MNFEAGGDLTFHDILKFFIFLAFFTYCPRVKPIFNKKAD